MIHIYIIPSTIQSVKSSLNYRKPSFNFFFANYNTIGRKTAYVFIHYAQLKFFLYVLGSVSSPLYETRKWYVVKHNCVTTGVFSDYNGQLHVSACTGHLQVVLGELNLRSYYKHSARTWCRDLYIRALFATSKATLWRCARQV